MQEIRTIATDDPVALASASISHSKSARQSVTRATALTHSQDGAISILPLLQYRSHLFHEALINNI